MNRFVIVIVVGFALLSATVLITIISTSKHSLERESIIDEKLIFENKNENRVGLLSSSLVGGNISKNNTYPQSLAQPNLPTVLYTSRIYDQSEATISSKKNTNLSKISPVRYARTVKPMLLLSLSQNETKSGVGDLIYSTSLPSSTQQSIPSKLPSYNFKNHLAAQLDSSAESNKSYEANQDSQTTALPSFIATAAFTKQATVSNFEVTPTTSQTQTINSLSTASSRRGFKKRIFDLPILTTASNSGNTNLSSFNFNNSQIFLIETNNFTHDILTTAAFSRLVSHSFNSSRDLFHGISTPLPAYIEYFQTLHPLNFSDTLSPLPSHDEALLSGFRNSAPLTLWKHCKILDNRYGICEYGRSYYARKCHQILRDSARRLVCVVCRILRLCVNDPSPFA